MQKEEVQKLIDDSLKETMLFSTAKYGDTPTDALQLANKKYVDSVVSPCGAVASNGAAISLPSGWSSAKNATGQYNITHTLNTTGLSVVAVPMGTNTRAVATSVLSSTVFQINVGNAANSAGEDNPVNFILQKF